MFKGLGITTDTDYFTNGTHTATYVATNDTRNMSSGSVTPHKRHVIPVYDSFGDTHNVHISYLRLSNTEWAAEIHMPQNEDGTFDVSDTNPIGNGTITFDGQGRLSSVTSGLQSATFNWTNGADPSTIAFDYGALLGSGETGDLGLTQNAGDYTETMLHPNGHKAGGVERIEFETNGKVLIHYSNGVSSHYAQIPIVKVADPDGLVAIGSGQFLTAVDRSGAGILTKAGVNGVGTFVPDSLEASKVDDSVMTKVAENQFTASMSYRLISKQEELRKFMLQNI
jgi:flagellar hook protein FlgE